MRRLVPLLLLVLLAGAGCRLGLSAQTDRDRYAIGDEGRAIFRNEGPVEVFLEGCSTFVFEQLVEGEWTLRGPAVICVWEGFARPVAPGDKLVEAFFVGEEPGIWRLGYRVGFACDPDQPLSDASCRSIRHVRTPPFVVQRPCDPVECGPQLGMPNRLCPDGVNFAGPTGRCLRDPSFDVCGWEIASCPDEPIR
jgi:hypothetical protein